MRILLALITIFAVFQTQAHCYIEGNNTRPDVDAEPITLDLDTNNTSKTENINFHSLSAPNFECLQGEKTPNKFFIVTTPKANSKIFRAIPLYPI